MSVEVDGVLKEWGDRLFYTKPKGRKAARTIGGGRSKAPETSARPATGSVRAALGRTARKAPEVMVKITRGRIDPSTGKRRVPCRDMGRIKNHLNYIGRAGEVTLEDELGVQRGGPEAVQKILDEWRSTGGKAIPERKGYRREAYSLVLSMPAGTPAAPVLDAARRFAKEVFGNHQYVFAAHNDRDHPHVHLAVRAVSFDMVRLNPRKADLQQWREHFAEKLRDNGIEANATARAIRGRVRKPEPQDIGHLQSRGQASKAKEGRTNEATRAALDPAQVRPADARLAEQRTHVLTGYRAVASALAGSKASSDRQLAIDLVKLAKGMEPPVSWHAGAVDQVRKGGAVPAIPTSPALPPQLQQTGAAQIHFVTEHKNERPNYKHAASGHVTDGAKAVPVRAGLHQSGPAASWRDKPATTVASMRNVSGIALVREQAGAQVLLQANARDRVGQREQGAPSADVRRPGAGDRGTAGQGR